MELGNLAKADEVKIIKFLQKIQVSNEISQKDFRRKVLMELDNVFGYEHTSFWLINKKLELHDPICINFDEQEYILCRYTEEFYKYDPFYPQNVPSKILFKKDLVRPKDLNLQNGRFNHEYTDFLSANYRVHHKLVLQFHDESGIFAGIGFFIPRHIDELDNKELLRLKTLAPFISRALSNKLAADALGCKNDMFELMVNQSQVGILTFDDYFKVHYSNPAAKEYCAELCDKQKQITSLESFLKQYFMDNVSPVWRFGLEKELLSNSLHKYTMKVIPTVKNGSSIYTVYLFPSLTTNRIDSWMPDDLTSREKEIIPMISMGLTNQEIADRLIISLSTVKSHVENIYRKFHVTNRTSLCSKLKDS